MALALITLLCVVPLALLFFDLGRAGRKTDPLAGAPRHEAADRTPGIAAAPPPVERRRQELPFVGTDRRTPRPVPAMLRDGTGGRLVADAAPAEDQAARSA